MDDIKNIQLNDEAILSWFKGKARENAAAVLAMVHRSQDAGFWEKGASRKARAILSKANVAQRVARIADDFYEAAEFEHEDGKPCTRSAWFSVYMAMHYGNRVGDLGEALEILNKQDAAQVARTMPIDRTDADRDHALNQAVVFAGDFGPLVRLMARLDARRPALCVRVLKTLSPTVAKNLVGDLNLKLDTLRYPEVELVWVTKKDKKGHDVEVQVIRIVWPAGTIHNASKYAAGSAQNALCHACGHAIKDPSNWVPFLVDGQDGVPRSFWVGHDCARKVFGCDVSGECEYANREGV